MAPPNQADRLTADISRHLRDYRTADDATRTELRAALAARLVDLRELFTSQDRTDYLGQSHGYRTRYAAAVEGSGMSKAEAKTARSTLAYHVVNELHERLTPEQLAAYGINPRTRGERRKVTDAHAHAMLLLSAAATIDDPTSEARRALRYSASLLRLIVPETLDTPEAREQALATLEDIRRRVAELTGHLGG